MIYARGWGALAGWQANKWGCGNQPSSHDGGRTKFTHGEKGDAPGARLLHESSGSNSVGPTQMAFIKASTMGLHACWAKKPDEFAERV